MYPHKDWFSTYDPVDSTVAHMGNNVQCNVSGIGTVKIKTHDGVVRTLSNVCHVPNLKITSSLWAPLNPRGPNIQLKMEF